MLRLDECAGVDELLIGGKARGLGGLFEAGLAVPAGFVIVSEATAGGEFLNQERDTILRAYRALTANGWPCGLQQPGKTPREHRSRGNTKRC